MKIIGKSYRVIAVVNPLGLLPSRVYPVFHVSSEDQNSGRVFRQIPNRAGVIDDFLEVRKSNDARLIAIGSFNKLASVGNPAIYGYALREKEVILAKGMADFKGLLQDLFTEGQPQIFQKNPLAAVEVSRLLEDEDLEIYYAKLVTKKLASKSVNVAVGWLNNSPISIMARMAALRTLSNYRKRHHIPEEEEDIRSVKLSENALAQGDFVKILWSGKTVVRDGGRLYRGFPIPSISAVSFNFR